MVSYYYSLYSLLNHLLLAPIPLILKPPIPTPPSTLHTPTLPTPPPSSPFNPRPNLGVRETGAAIISPQRHTATLTVIGGNQPHGEIRIVQASRQLLVEEGISNATVYVERIYGAIGQVGGFFCQCGP